MLEQPFISSCFMLLSPPTDQWLALSSFYCDLPRACKNPFKFLLFFWDLFTNGLFSNKNLESTIVPIFFGKIPGYNRSLPDFHDRDSHSLPAPSSNATIKESTHSRPTTRSDESATGMTSFGGWEVGFTQFFSEKTKTPKIMYFFFFFVYLVRAPIPFSLFF